jgi:phage FluMu protein Com
MTGEFIWRCTRCSNHFSIITTTQGIIKQEKKCPKCKWLNILTLTDKEIFIHCKPGETAQENYYEETGDFPMIPR